MAWRFSRRVGRLFPPVSAAALAAVSGSAAAGCIRCDTGGVGAEEKLRLQAELAKLRPREKALRERWIAEEEGWHKLPARAWPAVQPKAAEIPGLRAQLEAERCPPPNSRTMTSTCRQVTFDLASGLVFSHADSPAGFQIYCELAGAGDLDAMVGAATCLGEGLGAPRDDAEAVRWLREAAVGNNAQAKFELAMGYFAGSLELDEDEAQAFALFQEAATQGHSSANFMVGDCLLEGAGCPSDPAASVPYLLRAAEKGHRGARQHLRQLLDGQWMGFSGAGGPAQITL